MMKETREDVPTDEVLKLIHDVRLKKIVGSHHLTSNTISLLTQLITKSNWKTAEELLVLIRRQGRFLVEALPHDTTVGNAVRRVLKVIRDEYDSSAVTHFDDVQSTLSLHKLVTQTSDAECGDYSKPRDGLKDALLDHLSEIETELETCADSLSSQASQHIHSEELIMTIGYSHNVEKFLKKAAVSRPIEVVVVECAPDCQGHQMAVNLAKANIQTTLIPDSSIFALMSRINKVIIGTHSVLANGGLQAVCGAHSLALAAKHYSVPVIVLTPSYKLTPMHVSNYKQADFSVLTNTEGVIPYSLSPSRFCHSFNPLFEYVPPELVTLLITNIGANAPSYIYRLLNELYHADDANL